MNLAIGGWISTSFEGVKRERLTENFKAETQESVYLRGRFSGSRRHGGE